MSYGTQGVARPRGRRVGATAYPAQYSYGNAGGGLWTPEQITTKGWFDADDTTTDYVTQAAGSVSQWDDRSPEAEHVVQATGTSQPRVGIYTIGGLRSIYFDGSNDNLDAATNVFGASVGNAAVFAVIKTITITQGSLFSLSSNTGVNEWHTHCPWQDGNIYFDVGGSTGANRVSGASGFSVNDENLVSFIVDTSLQEIRLNGDVLASDATGHSATTAGGIRIGGDPNYRQDVAVGEVVIVEGSISAGDRQKVEGYLAHKWGLESKLDAGHPYKSEAP